MLERNLKYEIRSSIGWAQLLIASLFMLISFGNAFGQVDAQKDSADQAYVNEQYTAAIQSYEQILSQEYVSAEVHYNLGNAYFKMGKIAPSILNYERALKLAPNDEDIQFNLRLANLSVKDKVEEIPQLFFVRWWEQILKTFTVDGWAWSAVVALILSLAGLLLFRFSSEEGMRRLTFYTGIIALIWCVFSIYAAQTNYDHAVNDNRAVVFASTINAKSAPDKKGKDLFVIHEGLVVSVSDELNGWSRIKLTNGNVGWVPSEALERI
ncbi:MAG: tetratricopeptide repeat protein [Flavobacteriales bacterium]|nr:tetratricopeptide repeat protein [Flavobacteriales bacterium]